MGKAQRDRCADHLTPSPDYPSGFSGRPDGPVGRRGAARRKGGGFVGAHAATETGCRQRAVATITAEPPSTWRASQLPLRLPVARSPRVHVAPSGPANRSPGQGPRGGRDGSSESLFDASLGRARADPTGGRGPPSCARASPGRGTGGLGAAPWCAAESSGPGRSRPLALAEHLERSRWWGPGSLSPTCSRRR